MIEGLGYVIGVLISILIAVPTKFLIDKIENPFLALTTLIAIFTFAIICISLIFKFFLCYLEDKELKNENKT